MEKKQVWVHDLSNIYFILNVMSKKDEKLEEVAARLKEIIESIREEEGV